jgi:beta-xylosidase
VDLRLDGFTDVDGKHYLYFGSYYGGISVTELTSDGLRAVGPTPRIAIDNRYEAAYVVRHDGWVYFFGSSAELLRRARPRATASTSGARAARSSRPSTVTASRSTSPGSAAPS